LELLEYATFYTQRFPNKDYDMVVTFQTYLQEPDEWLYGQYHTKGSKNWYGISNPELDQMLEEQRRILDVDERTEKVHEIQRYAMENVMNPMPLITHITQSPY